MAVVATTVPVLSTGFPAALVPGGTIFTSIALQPFHTIKYGTAKELKRMPWVEPT